MIDVALALDRLVPGADYLGSLTAGTQAAYDALEWRDGRPKPSWAEIEQAVAAARRAETAADPTDRTWSFELWQF